MSTYYDDPIHYAVADAMIEHGPDGHIDGYEEIAEAAINAYLRLTPEQWEAKREQVAEAMVEVEGFYQWPQASQLVREAYLRNARVAMTAMGFTRT